MSEPRDMEFNRIRKRSVQLLHIVTAVDEQRAMLSFCCESQPLATVRSYGVPVRCPFCQQARPVGGKKKADGAVERQNPASTSQGQRNQGGTVSERPTWHLDVETAQRECRTCFAKWQALTNRMQKMVEEHEEYAPDAFKASILGLMPEYVRAANAAVARLQIMVQIKCGEMRFHGDEPEELGN